MNDSECNKQDEFMNESSHRAHHQFMNESEKNEFDEFMAKHKENLDDRFMNDFGDEGKQDNKQTNKNTRQNNETSHEEGCNEHDGFDFQTLNPDLFVMVGALLGDVMSNQLPFNMQNAVGNWLQLVGQTILTYNAQQQYFQAGPGRYYDLKNYNILNPFCPSESAPNSMQSKLDKATYDATVKKITEEVTASFHDEIETMQQNINILLQTLSTLETEVYDLKKLLEAKDNVEK